ncbi:MAG TPA: SsrA-binding protein SmpB [Capsulimonadaceae bacterium]|nr:SsrA-binding protein SmpB [Capsulimonadaceae bacterium]
MPKKKDKEAYKPVTLLNRQARHEYEIGDTFEAGLVLTGTEVKSLRLGRANLSDAFCRVQDGEVWLYNMHVSPYEMGNRYNVEERRPRKLLLHRWQIVRLQVESQTKGLTIVPTKLYFSRGKAKIEIGVGRGRKLYDRRERIADRDRDRETRRELAEKE